MKTVIRVLRGRKGRISKWFVEVDNPDGRRLVEVDGRKFWNNKDHAITASRRWAEQNGEKATFVFPSRDGV